MICLPDITNSIRPEPTHHMLSIFDKKASPQYLSMIPILSHVTEVFQCCEAQFYKHSNVSSKQNFFWTNIQISECSHRSYLNFRPCLAEALINKYDFNILHQLHLAATSAHLGCSLCTGVGYLLVCPYRFKCLLSYTTEKVERSLMTAIQ